MDFWDETSNNGSQGKNGHKNYSYSEKSSSDSSGVKVEWSFDLYNDNKAETLLISL